MTTRFDRVLGPNHNKPLPIDRAAPTLIPGRYYEGHKLTAGMVIYSTGKTPWEAIQALCQARFGTDLEGELRPLEGGDPAYAWGFRFTSDGTHFKAAGIFIPGGALCTWWK